MTEVPDSLENSKGFPLRGRPSTLPWLQGVGVVTQHVITIWIPLGDYSASPDQRCIRVEDEGMLAGKVGMTHDGGSGEHHLELIEGLLFRIRPGPGFGLIRGLGAWLLGRRR